MRYAKLEKGDPAPLFQQLYVNGGGVKLDGVAGRWIVLCFIAPTRHAADQKRLTALCEEREALDRQAVDVYAVSASPGSDLVRNLAAETPAIPIVADKDGHVSRAYGVLPLDALIDGVAEPKGLWIVLDAALRVHATIPFDDQLNDLAELRATLSSLPPLGTVSGFEPPAPVLMIPDVFDRAYCAKLIGLYDSHGGQSSGVMRTVGGKTLLVEDPTYKVRKDFTITDNAVIGEAQAMIRRRVLPEILKVHYFRVTRMERYIVCCYAAEDGAHFKPHRDNTTKATEHRRFAVSINLNDTFDGGEVSFPEYGPRGYKAPAGSAIVFSCSLLHAVSPVTKGRRYAFLPFLYDDAAAQIRERNNAFLGEGVTPYRASTQTQGEAGAR